MSEQPYKRREQIGNCTLYLGDCRDILPTLDKVDAVVTDPPYFVPTQTYVPARGQQPAKRMLGDISIMQSYFDWLVGNLPVGDSGHVYMFCDAKSYPIFWKSMFPNFKHVRTVIWDKQVSYNGYTWRHQHEIIAWGECEKAPRIPTGDGDILKFRGVLQKDRNHPAEKPVELLGKIVGKHEGVILDPFMGSGSCGVACVENERDFVGIEIEDSYFDIACRRIDDAYRQADMFVEN